MNTHRCLLPVCLFLLVAPSIVAGQEPRGYQPAAELIPTGRAVAFRAVEHFQGFTYALSREGELAVYDTRDLPESTEFVSYREPILQLSLGNGLGIIRYEEYLYVYGGSGFDILDLAQPEEPAHLGTWNDFESSIFSMALDGDRLAFGGLGIVGIYNLQFPARPQVEDVFELPSGAIRAFGIALEDDLLIASGFEPLYEGNTGLYIFYRRESNFVARQELGYHLRLIRGEFGSDYMVECTSSHVNLYGLWNGTPLNPYVVDSQDAAGRVCALDGDKLVTNGSVFQVETSRLPVYTTFSPDGGQADGFPYGSAVTDDFVFLAQSTRILVLRKTPAEPRIVVEPAAVEFGEVNIGEQSTRTLTISNTGQSGLSGYVYLPEEPEEFWLVDGDGEFWVGPGDQIDFQIAFVPGSAELFSTWLHIGHNAPNEEDPLVVALTGTGARLESRIEVDPAALDFGEVMLDDDATLAVTISNTGDAGLSGYVLVTGENSGDFMVVDDIGEFWVWPGEQLHVHVAFEPLEVGRRAAELHIGHNAPNEEDPLVVRLSGTGAQALPHIEVVPRTVSFGDVVVEDRAVRTIVISNTGSAALSGYFDLEGSGNFAIINDVDEFRIDPGEELSIDIEFFPTEPGDRGAEFRIFHEAPNEDSPIVVQMTGRGVMEPEPAISVAPDSGNFGSRALGDSAEETFTISSTGNADLTGVVELTGPDAAAFSITSGGGSFSIGPEQQRNVSVRFTPETRGGKSAILQISHNATNAPSPLAVSLSGTGVAPLMVVLPDSVDFGAVVAGRRPVKPVSVLNDGSSSLSVSSITLTGTGSNAFVVRSQNPPISIPSGGSTVIDVEFRPPAEGLFEATLQVSGNDPDHPQLAVALRGSGREIRVSVPPDVAPASAVNVAFDIPDDVPPSTGTLFFRPAGARAYSSTAINIGENGFQASIPASVVTMSGVQYYAEFFFDEEDVVTFPAEDPRFRPAFFAVRVPAGEGPPFGMAGRVYRMVSVPLELDESEFLQVLEDDLGPYSRGSWRFFRWRTDRYIEFPDISGGFEPGRAFWLVTSDDRTFTAGSGTSVDAGSEFRITLDPGWNQIATPFSFPIYWHTVRTAAPGIEDPVYWDGTEMLHEIFELDPWEGYFVYNASNAPVNIFVPPEASPFGDDEPQQIAGRTAADDTAGEIVWQLSARVDELGLRNTQNWIGFSEETGERSRLHEAPAIGPHLRLSIIENGTRYARLLKPEALGEKWELEIAMEDVAGQRMYPARVAVSLPDERMDDYDVYLVDIATREMIGRRDEGFELRLSATGTPRRFHLVLAHPDHALGVLDTVLPPADFRLLPNYPNPFNPSTTIPYHVGEAGEVALDVLDVLGRRVRTLVSAPHEPGRYSVTWDATDASGTSVSGGPYLIRMRGPDFSTTRIIVVVR